MIESLKRLETFCDCIAIQEVHDRSASLFEKMLSGRFRYKRVLASNEDAGGLAFFSKYPINYSENVMVQKTVKGSLFPCSFYEVQIKEEKVLIVNVHLRPPVEMSGKSSVFSMLKTSEIRRNEMETIVKAITEKGYKLEQVIVLGDFNENDGQSALSYLLFEKNMQDALCLTDKWTHWWLIFHGFLVRKRLDHICCGSNFLPVEVDVLDHEERKGSDHYPVYAKVKLK